MDRTADYLTSSEAARILGLSSMRVKQLADANLLPHLRSQRGIRMFREEDVEAYRAKRAAARALKRAKRATGRG